MKKNYEFLIIAIIVIAFIGSVFIYKGAHANIVLKSPGPITLNGFQYGKDFNVIEPYSLTIKNIKVIRLPKKEIKNNKRTYGTFYSLNCDVYVNSKGKKISFHFKGTNNVYYKPESNNSLLPFENGTISCYDGACYDIKSKKALDNYLFLIAPDFSFANLLMNPPGKKGFALNDFFQILDGKWACIIPLYQPDLYNNSKTKNIAITKETKAYFFENGIKGEDFRKVAKEGPIPEFLRKQLGRTPTKEEVMSYIKSKLSQP